MEKGAAPAYPIQLVDQELSAMNRSVRVVFDTLGVTPFTGTPKSEERLIVFVANCAKSVVLVMVTDFTKYVP